jgi:hypothetical protein
VEVVARVVDVDRDVEHRRERRPAARREVPRRVQAGDGLHGHLVLGELVVDLDAENNPGDDCNIPSFDLHSNVEFQKLELNWSARKSNKVVFLSLSHNS